MSNPENNSSNLPEAEDRLIGEAEITAASATEQAPEHEKSGKRFDYVVPKESYKNHQKTRKKARAARAKKPRSEGRDDFYKDFIFSSPRKKRRRRKRFPLPVRILIGVLCVVLALTVLLSGTYFILNEIGCRGMHNFDNLDIQLPTQQNMDDELAKVRDKGYTIVYDGHTYALKRKVMSIVFIGYNNDQDVTASEGAMADAIYIAAIDTSSGKTSLIGVSRDTMTDVAIYSTEGKFIDTDKRPISYAYSYSSADVAGGKNLCTSLERLFFGMTFENYIALNLESVEQINDAIGGVTLTSTITFHGEGRTIYEGEEVTLHGSEARTYIQTRDTDVLDSNNARMERQRQYIMAFISSILPAAKEDLSTVTNLFSAVSENSDTTLDLPKVTYISSVAVSKMRSASDVEYVSLPGEIKDGGEYAELYIDDKTILEAMLKVFYKQID